MIGRRRLDKIDRLMLIGRVTSRAAIQEQHNTLVVSITERYRCISQIYYNRLNRFSHFLVFSTRRGREMTLHDFLEMKRRRSGLPVAAARLMEIARLSGRDDEI